MDKSNQESPAWTADKLKQVLTRNLLAAGIEKHNEFLEELDQELDRTKTDIWVYLPQAGITPEVLTDITPTEIGHFARFLKLNYSNLIGPLVEVATRRGLLDETPSQAPDPEPDGEEEQGDLTPGA